MRIRLSVIMFLMTALIGTASFGDPTFNSPSSSRLESAQGFERVQLLNQLSEELIEKNPDQALSYAYEATALARSLGLGQELADSLNNTGYALFREDLYPDAVKRFQEAIAQSDLDEYPRGYAMGRNGYGMVWSALGEYQRALDDFEKALRVFVSIDDLQGQAYALNNIGTVHHSLGAYDQAIAAYISALKINEQLKNQDEIATSYNNIGAANAGQNNFEAAYHYYSEALSIYEQDANDVGRADTLMNMGNFFRDFGYTTEALDFYSKALNLLTSIDSKPRIANAFTALGYVSELNGDAPAALAYYEDALKIGEQAGLLEISINAWNNIGTVYHNAGDYKSALNHHISALEASKKNVYEQGLESALKNIANDYQKMSRFQEANHYFILYNELRDALNEREQSRNFANSQTLYETEKKDQEIEAQRTVISQKEARARLLLGITFAAIAFLSITGTMALVIAKEKKKSEALLLNILPPKVADDLKRTGRATPERFDDVTILFSDIVDFTAISSSMDPTALIEELNRIFTAFDAILDRNGCQRIKTIGDAYFAVCGLPDPVSDHAHRIAVSALEMLDYLDSSKNPGSPPWEIRIGIHTGPVVGGVVGVRKYIYDVFGDTVNTASRMESNSIPMRINVSETTKRLLEDHFSFDEREPLPVKGKGLYKMYFIVPNK